MAAASLRLVRARPELLVNLRANRIPTFSTTLPPSTATLLGAPSLWRRAALSPNMCGDYSR